jgi:hypothetical protein
MLRDDGLDDSELRSGYYLACQTIMAPGGGAVDFDA